jgi:predicted GIY-YIG superfamily endonuclease
MPKVPIDYSKGFIYKLCCLDVNIKEIYIGSSTNFKQRKRHHKNVVIMKNKNRIILCL